VLDLFRPAARMALTIAAIAAIGTATLGHFQGMLTTKQQPMKMAAAAAHYDTEEGAGLSLFAIGGLERNPGPPKLNVTVPKLESFMATGDFNGRFEGINDLQRQYEQKYGPGDYVPIVGATYWSFRIMVGAGTLAIALSLLGLWLTRGGRPLDRSRLFLWGAIGASALPFVANSAGWILREVGRQPWVVHGLLHTSEGVSPSVGTDRVLLTLLGFFAIYSILLFVAGRVFVRMAKEGPAPPPAPPPAPELPAPDGRPTRPDLALTY
jgi:cytochrome d ubiquinol oxidase subunit I